MANTFHCPSCLASLDHNHVESLAVKCPYCGTSVIVPEALRAKTADPKTSFDVFSDRSLNGLVEVANLARGGRKIEAVKRYRELFDVSLKDAKDVVDQMVVGGVVQLGGSTVQSSSFSSTSHQSPYHPLEEIQPRRSSGCSLILLIILALVGVGGYFLFTGLSPEVTQILEPVIAILPEELAAVVEPPAGLNLQFGSEGIGPGKFNDTRYIGVDGQGNIYTADFSDGRVQQFDGAGNFMATWNVDTPNIRHMVASRQGQLYIMDTPRTISVFDGSSGELQNQFEVSVHTDTFALAPDGSLVVYTGHPEDTLHFYQGGTIARSIPNFLAQIDEDLTPQGLTQVAVDGAGNIFALNREDVFRFNGQGQFQGRAAVSADTAGPPSEADLLFNPQALAVDGRGQLYVADWNGIKIFDTNDRYVNTIRFPEPSSIAFTIAITDQDEIFAMDRNGNQVLKYEMNDQNGQ